ncbi:MAG: phospho-N-acetylmuramoyl-pentapeptide-transferase [Symploca sp. SIO1A3]|nr:phospho-N-acetylmuramoyl-pentapeptide-transferase [Symploca sp. SIO2C1]NER52744.1 phospho-N-acetylmuramoyl-pentapeptide-transferase [Symploca sp. SIO1A3]
MIDKGKNIIVVDAKISSGHSSKLTGFRLLALLTAGLSLGAFTLDWIAGRSPFSGMAMTLPLVICTLITAALGLWVVPLLRSLKLGQIIREDGPQTHLKKAGTPTMGGVFVVPVAVAIALLWSGSIATTQDLVQVLVVSLVTLAYAGIGWLDDWQIIRRCSNKGISPRLKLALQIGVGLVFCSWLAWNNPVGITNIILPFGVVFSIGLLFWPLVMFVLLAETNATNLTDGVDGLAAGTGAIALLGLGAVIAPTSPGLMIFCACLSGSYLGFVCHNHNPAKVFMGDTGSLALGGALATVGILTQNLWCLFILSGLFFVECLSVILQVSYFKYTKKKYGEGKRILRMSPFHNHLELSGWSETKIVGVFYIINGILACLCCALHTGI